MVRIVLNVVSCFVSLPKGSFCAFKVLIFNVWRKGGDLVVQRLQSGEHEYCYPQNGCESVTQHDSKGFVELFSGIKVGSFSRFCCMNRFCIGVLDSYPDFTAGMSKVGQRLASLC